MTIPPRERPHPDLNRSSRRSVLAAALALGGVLGGGGLAAPARAAGTVEAERFVAELGERTLAVLADATLSQDGKVERLVALVDEAADLELIARLSLGRTWRSLDDGQRADYVALFRAMLRRVMAERLGTYSGERFELGGATPVDERDSMVTTLVGKPGDPPIRVDWRVRTLEGGRLAVVDVVAEGVSLLVTQRAEFGEIVAREGVDGLFAMLRERAGPERGS